MKKAGEEIAHPEARSVRVNEILREELVAVVVPREERVHLPLRSLCAQEDTPSSLPSLTPSSLVLGKKPRSHIDPPTKRRPPSSKYTFLESPCPLPPPPSHQNVPKYVSFLDSLYPVPPTPSTAVFHGLVYSLSTVSGSDIYLIDVFEASDSVKSYFERAKKERITVVHRSKERVGAGRRVWVVDPVCVEEVKMYFVAVALKED